MHIRSTPRTRIRALALALSLSRARARSFTPCSRGTRTGTQLGRPVLYQLYGTDFCAKKLEEKAGLSGNDLADYYTWMLERTLALMGAFPLLEHKERKTVR